MSRLGPGGLSFPPASVFTAPGGCEVGTGSSCQDLGATACASPPDRFASRRMQGGKSWRNIASEWKKHSTWLARWPSDGRIQNRRRKPLARTTNFVEDGVASDAY